MSNESVHGEPWWIPVKGAKWNRPEGRLSNISERWNHPVVHISHVDAVSFCERKGKRLPTEEEWEFAAQSHLKGAAYPWGDKFQRDRCNLWQGVFPFENHRKDGYGFTSPVDAYLAQSEHGLFDMVGNVWEWTSTLHRTAGRNKERQFILKGASFIDFREDNHHINHPARISSRMHRMETYSAQNTGFRCAKDYRVVHKPQPDGIKMKAHFRPRKDEL